MDGNKHVTIPNEVADAIEYLRSCHVWDDALIGNCFNGTYFESKCSTRRLLANYAVENPAKTVNAIINGYDREMTAEQRAHIKIRRLYGDKRYTASNGLLSEQATYDSGFADGIKLTLNEFGIKINGVNV